MSRSTLVRFGLSIAVMVCATQFAQAGFVPGFTGNSQTEVDGSLAPHPASDGLINFAVWDTSTGTTGNWIFDFATDYGVTTTTLTTLLGASGFEPYVYLYQVVNTNPVAPDSPLHLLQVEGGAFSDGGYLTMGGLGAVFNELGGTPTGPPANTALGTATTDAIPGNNSPGDATGALAATPFAAVAGAETPTGLTHLLAENLFQFEFPNLSAFPPLTDHSIVTAGYSTVVFLVSDLPPAYLTGRVHNGDVTYGDVPSNTPEPGSLVTLLGAVACGLVALRACKKS